MKNVNKFVCSCAVALLACVLFTSCSDQDNVAKSKVEVRLTDGPGDFEKVNIDLQEVQINVENSGQTSGWQSLQIKKGVYDLLKLTNGLDTLLGAGEFPSGKISQIRLVLGANNSIQVDGISYPLATPSAMQSGLKILVNEELKAGITYTILLDFDAARSIVTTGAGSFNLKPVIRSRATATDGAIRGKVEPAAAEPAIFAILGTDSTSAYADPLGNFIVKGLSDGTYRLVLVPKPGYSTLEKTDVVVSVGNVTDVGTLQILP